jgi:GT2 family glycosyltransferase
MNLLDIIQESMIDTVYVVDNSSTNIIENSLSHYSKVEYIWGHGNIGYGSAHNIAIKKSIQASSTYHIVLNPDISFVPGDIEVLCSYMDNNSDVAQLLPKVLYPNSNIQYLCKLIPTPFDLFFRRFLPKRLIHNRMNKFELRFTGYNHIMNVPYLSGCFMFFRVTAFKNVGLFDERFFMYPEDIDITRRMHELYRTIYYPFITVIHNHAAESYKSQKMMWIHILNMIKYFNKWGWLIDSKRKQTNRKVLDMLKYK